MLCRRPLPIHLAALVCTALITLLAGCDSTAAWIAPAERAAQAAAVHSPSPDAQAGAQELPAAGEQPAQPVPSLLPSPTPDAEQAPAEQASAEETPPEQAPVDSAQPSPAAPPDAGAADGPFALGNELTIDALRARQFEGSDIVFEETLPAGANYAQYIASYLSEGNKVYGLLTVPSGDAPERGFPAIVFIHGYIPPADYRTTERYVAYVDALARSGFVVFKIDLRGFGRSEGEATGAYFSPDYTVDAISALKSLQRLEYVDADAIGLWGHSMAGNVVLRAMLVEPDVEAGVIWAGAVYSYDDMVRYAIDDPSFRREEQPDIIRPGTRLREHYGPPDTQIPFWRAVSLTENIEHLQAPLQIHHAADDPVVNIGYSLDLVEVLKRAGKAHEFHQHAGGGHNIASPYFADAMQRTIEFFRAHL